MDVEDLIAYFRAKYEEGKSSQTDCIDLLFLAVEKGETDLNKIGFAARRLAAELGDGVRLEGNMFGLMLFLGIEDRE
jgi:hypothetical protein